MSASSPMSTAPASGDPRGHEPSMEEILASIRRIIADDQTMPRAVYADEAEPARQPEAPTPLPPVVPPSLGPIAAPQFPAPPAAPPPFRPEPPVEATHAEPVAARTFEPEPVSFEPLEVATIETKPVEPPWRSVQVVARPEQAPAHPEPSRHDAEPAPRGEPAVHVARDPHVEAERHLEPDPLHAERPPMPAGTRAAPLVGDGLPVAEVAPAAGGANLFSVATNHSVTSAFNVLAASRLADNSDELLAMARDMIRPMLRAWLDDNLPGMVERLVREEIERVARGGR